MQIYNYKYIKFLLKKLELFSIVFQRLYILKKFASICFRRRGLKMLSELNISGRQNIQNSKLFLTNLSLVHVMKDFLFEILHIKIICIHQTLLFNPFPITIFPF